MFADPVVIAWPELVEIVKRVEAGDVSAQDALFDLTKHYSMSVDDLAERLEGWGMVDDQADETS